MFNCAGGHDCYKSSSHGRGSRACGTVFAECGVSGSPAGPATANSGPAAGLERPGACDREPNQSFRCFINVASANRRVTGARSLCKLGVGIHTHATQPGRAPAPCPPRRIAGRAPLGKQVGVAALRVQPKRQAWPVDHAKNTLNQPALNQPALPTGGRFCRDNNKNAAASTKYAAQNWIATSRAVACNCHSA